MTRSAFIGSASLVFLACAALPACGQQDEAQAIFSECSDPSPNKIDTCLERARVEEETNPSKEMQVLVAKLIQRQIQDSEAAHRAEESQEAGPPPDDHGVSSYDVTPPEPPPSSDLGPLEPYQPPPGAQEEAPPDAQGDPSDTGPSDAGPPPANDPNAPADSSRDGGPGHGARAL